MDTELKDPVIVDGMPLYTLSSYEPVTVVVAVRAIDDREVDAAVVGALAREGGNMSKMLDNEWIHKKYPEVQNFHELRDYYREKIQSTNKEIVAERKLKECTCALADRLEQRILQGEIKMARTKMQQVFMEGLKKTVST